MGLQDLVGKIRESFWANSESPPSPLHTHARECPRTHLCAPPLTAAACACLQLRHRRSAEAPFLAVAIFNEGPNDQKKWKWTYDLTVSLTGLKTYTPTLLLCLGSFSSLPVPKHKGRAQFNAHASADCVINWHPATRRQDCLPRAFVREAHHHHYPTFAPRPPLAALPCAGTRSILARRRAQCRALICAHFFLAGRSDGRWKGDKPAHSHPGAARNLCPQDGKWFSLAGL